MIVATEYFKKVTGRAFYGLAGTHYSVPERAIEYQPNGEHIERWIVSVPSGVTLLALAASAIGFALAFRRASLLISAGIWALHVAIAVIYSLIAAWFWINVMGVFI